MQTDNEKIIEITEDELYDRYFDGDVDEIMDFEEYKRQMKKIGYIIKYKKNYV